MSCRTAVILIVFRRPDLTRQVFERIRAAKPPTLFVVADGPRTTEEQEICDQTRAVTEQVDWDCEVFRNYADENMGIRKRYSSGLDWAFENIDEAIILEDDTLPHSSFFDYCDELLERYRSDHRVWTISGDNFQRGQKRGDASYYFSRYNHNWGWATWKRAWKRYDHEMNGWPSFRDGRGLEEFLDDPLEVKYWTGIFDRLYAGKKPDSYSYVWTMSCWTHGGLSILPNVNLIENTGFGEDSTHTKGNGCWISSRPAEAICFPLVHPDGVECDSEADRYTFEHVYSGNRLRKELCWTYRLRRRLWRVKQCLMGHPVLK